MFQTMTLERPVLRDFCVVLLASFLIALSGAISIPLWFSPVPIATQPSVVLLMGALLGSKRSAAATFAFLAQGAMGLPVFSCCKGGVISFVGPTGGYLIGYLIAAYTVGLIIEKMREKSLSNTFFAMIAGNLVIYLCGSAYLATFLGLKKALLLGVAPFILGDLLKILAGLKIVQWARK